MERGKSKDIQNDIKTQVSYIFRKVRKSRYVLFGKEDLKRDFNEITGPKKRHAAMVAELVSNASSRGHKIMLEKNPDNKTFWVEISYTKSKIPKIAIAANSLNTLKIKAKQFGK